LEQPLSPHPRQGGGEDKAQILSADSLAPHPPESGTGQTSRQKKQKTKKRKKNRSAAKQGWQRKQSLSPLE